MLGVVSQQCCVRLHGAKSLTGFKLCENNTQHVTSNNVGQQCCVRLHAALQACGVHLQLKCQKKWLWPHLSKVLLHETIEARISQLTESLFSFSRSLSARRKKNTGDLFTASARFEVLVGVAVLKWKTSVERLGRHLHLQIIPYYTVEDR